MIYEHRASEEKEMAYHVSQEEMESRVSFELAARTEKGGELCSMLILEPESCNAESGELTLSHIVTQAAANPAGNLHGGIITWLLDSTMGILSRSYTGYETTVTMDIHVNFLRAVHVGNETQITARITHSGKTVINVCSEMVVNGRIVATADAIFFRTA